MTLANAKTLRCEYPEGSFRAWRDGKLEVAEPDKLTGAIHFDAIDREKGRARKIGNAAAVDVALLAGPEALTFVEPLPSGGANVITVFEAPGGIDPPGFSWVPSVSSSHTPIFGNATATVVYGKCALLLTP